jgi:hypothetical protein
MAVADWATIASLSTAGGTLVLAFATFSSVRSANRTARVAELSLLADLRAVLVPSRLEDTQEKVSFADDHWVSVRGGMGEIHLEDDAILLAMAVRNVGPGLAVLHGWHASAGRILGRGEHAPLDDFRMLSRDIYVPAGDTGFWQGAVREPDDALQAELRKAIAAEEPITVEVLYGDHEGGQRTISRFAMMPREGSEYVLSVSRHWSLDRPGPR